VSGRIDLFNSIPWCDPDLFSHALEQGVDGLDLEDPARDGVLSHSLKIYYLKNVSKIEFTETIHM
jgi:hypothetical protein